MSNLGILTGIGVGPGDPELITVKGLRLLQNTEVIAFPQGLNGKVGMAESIVNHWLKPNQIKLPLPFAFVNDDQKLTQCWQDSAHQVWKYLKLGQDVVFLSEGDVSFYSTFTYLAQTLQQLHPQVIIHTIPGICSPLAVSAVLGLPLTIKAQKLMVLPALYTMNDLEIALNTSDVLVLMKVSSVYPQVWEILAKRKLLNQSYIVEKATLPDMIIHRGLSDRPQLQLPYFSLLIVQINP